MRKMVSCWSWVPQISSKFSVLNLAVSAVLQDSALTKDALAECRSAGVVLIEDTYPLVNEHSYGKSPFLLGNFIITGQ